MAKNVDANPLVDPSNKNYYLLDTGERFIRVTSVMDGVGGEALISWAAGLAADYALEEITSLIKATRKMPCGNTYKRCKHEFGDKCENCRCGECPTCLKMTMQNRHYAEKSRRADEGTRTHAVVEHWSLHENIPMYDDDIEPYVRAFQAFVMEFGIKPDDFSVAEAAVINRTHGYAGTTDCIVHISPRTDMAADLIARVISRQMRLDAGDVTDTSIGITADEIKESGRGIDVLLDWKTREKEEHFVVNYALQLAAYRNGEVIRLRTAIGHEIAIPNIDAGVIVQLRPDGYTALPVVTSDDTFEAFVHLLEFKKWYNEFGSKSIGKRAFAPKRKTPKPTKKAAKVAPVETVAEEVAPEPKQLTQIERMRRQLEQTRARQAKKPKITPEEDRAMEVAEVRDKEYVKPGTMKAVKQKGPSTRLDTRSAVLGSGSRQSDMLFPDAGPDDIPF